MKTVGIIFLLMIMLVVSLVFLQVIWYNIVLTGYHLLIRVASLFNKKARAWVNGRKNLFPALQSGFHYPDHKKIWFHCASLGEFEQGRPVIEQIKKENPDCKILLTFYSPSGYEMRQNYAGADYVCYLPADTAANAKKFLDIVQPDLAVFIKYEFWYHHINTLKKKNIPLYLVSGIFRKKQIFFRWYGRIFRSMLKKYTRIFVQNKESVELLHKIKIQQVEIAYDTRFDRVKEIAAAAQKPEYIEKFVADHNIIVAGSTWPDDEKILAAAFYHSLVYVNFKIIVVPHEVDAANIKKTQKRFKKYSILYSELPRATDADLRGKRVLIIDNIGMLASLYQFADVNYVGGGFGKGVHNVLEAAVFGRPVMFGPNYKKFNEAVELVRANAGFCVTDRFEMLNRINLMNQFQFIFTNAGKDAENYVNSHTGGTQMIVEKLRPIFS